MVDFEIEALLRNTIGLKITSLGRATLDRSVQKRMQALTIADKRSYLKKLKSSALELKELIEDVVIPETWFFRDHAAFIAMNRYLVSRWAQKHENGFLKVLSVPCSTGEEPYSLAMSLLSSGWPAEKFVIHAVDISSRAIAKAKEGIYAEHSFRGTDLAYKTQYFQKKPQYYILNKNVRDKVHFHTGNVLHRACLEGLGPFDIIFFRNILIYFDTFARQQAIATLNKILNDAGILFVGHAETSLFSNSPFTPAPFRHAYAFYKKATQQLGAENRKFPAALPASGQADLAGKILQAPLYSKNANNRIKN